MGMFLIFEKEIVVFGSENSSCFFVVFCGKFIWSLWGVFVLFFFR